MRFQFVSFFLVFDIAFIAAFLCALFQPYAVACFFAFFIALASGFLANYLGLTPTLLQQLFCFAAFLCKRFFQCVPAFLRL